MLRDCYFKPGFGFAAAHARKRAGKGEEWASILLDSHACRARRIGLRLRQGGHMRASDVAGSGKVHGGRQQAAAVQQTPCSFDSVHMQVHQARRACASLAPRFSRRMHAFTGCTQRQPLSNTAHTQGPLSQVAS